MLTKTHGNTAIATPEEMRVLQEVFDEVCTSTGTDPNSPVADRLAKALMAAFEYGIRDKDDLLLVTSLEEGRPAYDSRPVLHREA